MTRVQDQELIQACVDSLPIFHIQDAWAYVFFTLQFNTGCRYIEVLEVSRWTDLQDGTYELDTAKNSNNRIIPASDVPTVYKNLILSGEQEFGSMRYTTATRLFKKGFPLLPLVVGAKDVSTHVYRYAKAKKMFIDGSTIQQISDYLGEVDNQNTLGYVNAEFYTLP